MAAAAVCGTKRSHFYEEENSPESAHKRFRRSPPAPILDAPVESRDLSSLSGEQWVEWLVKEMAGATSLEDAKSRAGRLLESLEKAVTVRVREEAAREERLVMEKRMEAMKKENGVLKRAVGIQHERMKEMEENKREGDKLLGEYVDKVKTLEVNNYSLSMHLKLALQGANSFPLHYNRDVF